MSSFEEGRGYPIGTRRHRKAGIFQKTGRGTWDRILDPSAHPRSTGAAKARVLDVDTGELHDVPDPSFRSRQTDPAAISRASEMQEYRAQARARDMSAPDALQEHEYWQAMADISNELVQLLTNQPVHELQRRVEDLHSSLLARGLPHFPAPLHVDASTTQVASDEDLGEMLGGFTALVGKETLGSGGLPLSVVSRDARAHYEPAAGVLDLGKQKTNPGLLYHEMGHWLEGHNGKVADAAWHFYQSRVKGDTAQTMKAATGGQYDDHEVTYEDHFIDPYVGKVHRGSRVSEVVATGMEAFSSPWGMLVLAKKDPEHFALMYGIATGRFGFRP